MLELARIWMPAAFMMVEYTDTVMAESWIKKSLLAHPSTCGSREFSMITEYEIENRTVKTRDAYAFFYCS